MSKETKKNEITKTNINVTRKEALEILDGLKSIAKTKLSVFIKYDIGHNICKLKEVEEGIKTAQNNDDIEGFKDYQSGMRDIILKYSKNGKIEGSENIELYEKDLKAYREEHQEIVDELEKKSKEIDEMLKTEVEIVDLNMLKLERFPQEMEQDLTPLIPLIER